MRGRHRILLGMAAGVGKTYRMLQEGRQAAAEGRDVVIGYLEPHDRPETALLADGLEVVPRLRRGHSSLELEELDVDAVVRRAPELALIDELAHTNAAGMRNAKRYQDIDEVLAAGVDVISTVNVQHLDSVSDAVGGITGIRVFETLPDRVFDDADEIVLVDLTPDELLMRMREGKVYMPQQAERAIQNFFRKGNLLALRELALRRTADRVDEEVRDYRRERAVKRVWKTGDALLVCIGADDVFAPGFVTAVSCATGDTVARRAGRTRHQIHS